jgi:uncharacterized protein (TIGR03118 family)
VSPKLKNFVNLPSTSRHTQVAIGTPQKEARGSLHQGADQSEDLTMKHRSIIAASISAVLACATQASADQGGGTYVQHNLVSDGSVVADHTDPNLVNGWGVAFNPFGFVWVANNGTGTSTLYDGDGNVQSLVVQIPSPAASTGGTPTGIVFNGTTGFNVTAAGVSGSAKFIFVTEDGVIAGWAPNVDATNAIVAVDNSSTTGAVYKGAALSAGGSGALLYVTDFHNGAIDVFDSTFAPVTPPSASTFVDRSLPKGYAPFGIQAINGDLYVTYAEQDSDKHDEVDGRGLGFVDVYDPNGHLLRRLASRGTLNAPWGIAQAPAGFGPFSNAILIGNFGDGHINAFDPIFGFPLGQLRGSNHQPIQIDGLWGIAFGNGFSDQPVNTLFFAAGPASEAHGLYGRIDASSNDGD